MLIKYLSYKMLCSGAAQQGGGGDAALGGRGSRRGGGRIISEQPSAILRTRPNSLASKKGTLIIAKSLQ